MVALGQFSSAQKTMVVTQSGTSHLPYWRRELRWQVGSCSHRHFADWAHDASRCLSGAFWHPRRTLTASVQLFYFGDQLGSFARAAGCSALPLVMVPSWPWFELHRHLATLISLYSDVAQNPDIHLLQGRLVFPNIHCNTPSTTPTHGTMSP